MQIWVRIAIGLALIGIWLRQPLIALFGLLVLVMFGIAWLWSRWSLRAVVYGREIIPSRIFPGETADLILRLTNQGPLPLAWVDVSDKLNENITLLVRDPQLPLQQTTPLLWYERVSWRYRIQARRRGRYRFDEVVLRSGDPFGILPREEERAVYNYLLVYPRLLSLVVEGLPARSPLGDMRTSRQLFEDPTLLAGARPYQRDDPLKRIHWPATARSQRLQSKLYEFTIMREAVVMVNTMTFSGPVYNPDLHMIDRLVELAAATVRHLLDVQYAVGLSANASMHGGISPVSVAPSRSEDQWMILLETLALLIVLRRESFGDMVLEQGNRLRWGTLVILVTAILEEELGSTILQLQRRGHRVIIFSLAAQMPGWLAALDVDYYSVEERDGTFYALREDVFALSARQ